MFSMFDRSRGDVTPAWAADLRDDILTEIRTLSRKVSLLMSLDATLSAKLTAIVAGLIGPVQAILDSNKAKDQKIADLTAQLTAEQQAELAEDEADAAKAAQEVTDTADLQAALGGLKTLVEGPDTPDVAPVPVEDVPAVIDGTTPVLDPAGDPVTEEVPAAGPGEE